jgi:nucleoside 2-deoxyribosyltransferase
MFMPTCFVIQPFDADKFDRRFEEVYSPAIRSAGLEPYRVDRDPAVEVPIDAIEKGIRDATVCLADITTDNPNVWYELGFAFASGRPVLMVCSDERTGKKYPFDIQHRTIIPYKADSPSDFDTLKSEITKRIKVLMTRTEALRVIEASEQVAPVQGLSQPELAVIAAVAGSVILPDEGIAAYAAKRDVETAGFTSVGFSIGVQRLRAKHLIELCAATGDFGEDYQVIAITAKGWDWIERNEDKFMLRRPAPEPGSGRDDVPF